MYKKSDTIQSKKQLRQNSCKFIELVVHQNICIFLCSFQFKYLVNSLCLIIWQILTKYRVFNEKIRLIQESQITNYRVRLKIDRMVLILPSPVVGCSCCRCFLLLYFILFKYYSAIGLFGLRRFTAICSPGKNEHKFSTPSPVYTIVILFVAFAKIVSCCYIYLIK